MVIQKIRSRRHYSENKSTARKELIKKRKLFFSQSIESSNNIAGNLIKFFTYNNYSIISFKLNGDNQVNKIIKKNFDRYKNF